MSLEARDITDSKVWEEFLAKHTEANFLQSWWWGEFYENLGQTVVRKGFYDGTKLVGLMLMIVEDAKRGKHILVPAGPIIGWKSEKLAKFVTKTMRQVAKEQRCIFVRVRPPLLSNDYSKNLFKELGFKSSPMHLHAELTWQLDLSKSDDQLLAEMRKKSRYELKQAKKLGIEVKSSTDPKKLDKFYEIQLETAKRHNFVPFSKKYLTEQFKVFATQNKVLLYEAYHQKQLLAQAFVIFYGKEAAYHYGTGTEAGRKYPGAYAIQWQAIAEAKKRGMERYNFWGVTKPEQTKHRFYGVSVFKRGFGGEEVEYLHAHDLIINPTRYLLDYLIESIRKKTRHL